MEHFGTRDFSRASCQATDMELRLGWRCSIRPGQTRYPRSFTFALRSPLGVYPTVSLSDARARREEARTLLSKGTDPSAAKKVRKRAASHADEIIAREWVQRQRK
jgi:hypothetical protein